MPSTPAALPCETRVFIVGTGLIGSSIGKGLLAAGVGDVAGWDRDPHASSASEASGCITRVAPTLQYAREADLVILAAPIVAVLSLLEPLTSTIAGDCVVTDTGSAKTSIAEAGALALGPRFVGGHPMAGAETGGPSCARDRLFYGATWVLTPAPTASLSAIAMVESLAATLGAMPMRMSPQDHDRAVAAVSHVPHLAAYGLAACAGAALPDSELGLAAGAFRDGTRVAASRADLWTGVLLDNREFVLQHLDSLTAWLSVAREAIAGSDAAQLHAMLEAARAQKARSA